MKNTAICFRIVVLGMLLTGPGCHTPQKEAESPKRNPATIYEDMKFKLEDSDATFEELDHLLRIRGPRTIRQALEIFEKRWPGFFRYYTLAYRSNSLHETSFEHPRAIVFNRDASLVITYNGSPHQHNFETLEVMGFDYKTKKFNFVEYFFKDEDVEKSVAAQPLPHKERRWGNRHIIASQFNPSRCRDCHGENAKPIFDNYFLWPGFYGSDDDRMIGHHFNPRQEGTRLFDQAGVEPEKYADFMESRKGDKTSRYEILPDPVPFIYDAQIRPNLHLLTALERLMHKKMAHELAADPRLRPWRYAILGAKFCDFSHSFVPENHPVVPPDSQAEMERLVRDIVKRRVEYRESVIKRTVELVPGRKYVPVTSKAGLGEEFFEVFKLQYRPDYQRDYVRFALNSVSSYQFFARLFHILKAYGYDMDDYTLPSSINDYDHSGANVTLEFYDYLLRAYREAGVPLERPLDSVCEGYIKKHQAEIVR